MSQHSSRVKLSRWTAFAQTRRMMAESQPADNTPTQPKWVVVLGMEVVGPESASLVVESRKLAERDHAQSLGSSHLGGYPSSTSASSSGREAVLAAADSSMQLRTSAISRAFRLAVRIG